MNVEKLLARAAAPAGAALVSLSAWGAGYAAVASERASTEPALAPQVGNLKTSCSAAPVSAVVDPPALAPSASPEPAEAVLPPQVGNLKTSRSAPPTRPAVVAGRPQ